MRGVEEISILTIAWNTWGNSTRLLSSITPFSDEDDEDPAVSVYYQRKQTLRSAEKTLPPHKVRSASRSLLTQDSRGVMQVTENLSRNTYSDMQATQDVRPLEPTYKKGLGFKTSTRIALNFLVNMPKSKLRNDNLAVLLQESQSKPTTIQ